MTKRSKKYEVAVRRDKTAEQVEKALELSDVDMALAEKAYPGEKGQASRMRSLFMDFLAALRPHGSPAKGNRSLTAYFQGETLVSFFVVRNYLIEMNCIRNSDSMSRVLAVAIEELAGIVKPKPIDKEPELPESAPVEIVEIPIPEPSVGESNGSCESDRELGLD